MFELPEGKRYKGSLSCELEKASIVTLLTQYLPKLILYLIF